MKKILFGLAIVLPVAFAASQASALPIQSHSPAITHAASPDLIEVKGGRGHGRGHGWGKHHGFKHHGWSRGRKVGWRGRGCPPGLWKQGRC
jgi:hypothetical protein